MFQTTFPNVSSYKLKDIETNFGWRQSCDNQNCYKPSYVRFLLVDNNNQYSNYLCSSCTAINLGIHQQQLSICDTYVKSAKPMFQQVRIMAGMKPPRANSHRDTSGYFNISIGDQHILITEFKCCRYMLSINWVAIQPNIKYKSFRNKKQVTDFAVEKVNNRYKTYLHNYIFHGTPFTMP